MRELIIGAMVAIAGIAVFGDILNWEYWVFVIALDVAFAVKNEK